MGAPSKCTLELDKPSFARLFADLREVLVELRDIPPERLRAFLDGLAELIKEGRAIRLHSALTVRAGVVRILAEPSEALRNHVTAFRAFT